MKPVEPILIVDLFPEERTQLLSLLSSLPDEAWGKATACTGWSVKDVALHLLGDDFGLLSRTPDFMFPALGSFESWEALVAFINESNALWVQATRRIGNDLLLKLLAFSGREVYQRLASLDLFAVGEAVDWAGPDPAPVWLDVAREYTERWMHQQHIREAVDAPGLMSRHYLYPALDTFIRALPHTYRDTPADDGALVKFIITGEAGGEWDLLKTEAGWQLYRQVSQSPTSVVTMTQNTAWRLFTKGIRRIEVEAASTFEGDRSLGLKILDAVSIIA